MTWDEIAMLVHRAQAGDRSAFGQLVERFQPTVYAVALSRLRNSVEAQELTQEVFVHAMTKLGQLRDAQCFAGWLRQIAARLAINRLTRRGPLHGGDPEAIAGVAAPEPTPPEQMLRKEACHRLYDGLDRLKPLDRDTLVAFYIRGRSLKQMSRDFETPIGTIKRRLHVARNRLRQELEDPAKAGRDDRLVCV